MVALPPLVLDTFGERVMALVDELARHSDEPGRLTRLYLSPAHRAAAEAVRAMMEAAGMAAHIDPVGTVVGRYEGLAPGAPALLIGSHIDSVVDAGRYDGPLGVACGIVLVEELHRRGERLPFAIEVLAFGDEENVRFPTNLSSSHALAGRYDPAWLDGRDRDGITLREALLSFGGDPDKATALARDPKSVIGYLEVHIEQGPVLERENLPIGIVSAIAGITRARMTVKGEAGHAGTVPMDARRDALAAAAEMIVAIERLAARRPDTVATVGALEVAPGASNVIAGRVDLSLDARAQDDSVRRPMVAAIVASLEVIAARRGVEVAVDLYFDAPATAMDRRLMATLEHAAKTEGMTPRRLYSGAGHDAMAMAGLCPAAMLFVRCKGGISHNPAESITADDADAAVRVLLQAVRDLAARHAPH
ncbi:allantoate amidohydrolase [Chelatococcus sp. SYSU_G07232]|uniref:Allantoate amidohydrolase n=1 Tax=Chelatococcus albus TaxID=3047466 RepID=A0ABT7ALC5_9HYPH|nr:allantoate amidohydrolase [Chelatococcus sp. SYSU_G07232]MDJ1160163.1 allantoate amidohydrolase [Chelatococcus sp. SYSU_G07232]